VWVVVVGGIWVGFGGFGIDFAGFVGIVVVAAVVVAVGVDMDVKR